MRANRTLSEKIASVVIWTVTIFVMVYLVVPIFAIVPLSFTSGSLLVFPIPELSLRWYRDFATNPLWTRSTMNSVLIASATTAAATCLGTLAALGLNRARERVRKIVFALLVLPLIIPVVITAVAVYYFFSALALVGTLPGLILAHTLLALPFVVITVSATLKGFDDNMIRAAASLGAPPLLAFRKITFPLIFPGILSGAVFAFATSFDEIVVALFVGSAELRTLPRQIFSGVAESVTPTITAAAVVLLAISVSLMAVVELLRRRSERLQRATTA